jgi:hypothetical protein
MPRTRKSHPPSLKAKVAVEAGQRLFLPAPNLGRVDAEHLRDLGGRLVRLDGLRPMRCEGDSATLNRRLANPKCWSNPSVSTLAYSFTPESHAAPIATPQDHQPVHSACLL